MNNEKCYTERIYEWITVLTFEQREYLVYKHGTVKKAMEVWEKAKASGMIDFEILRNQSAWFFFSLLKLPFSKLVSRKFSR